MTFLERFLEWSSDGLYQNDEAVDYLIGRGVSEEQWRKHRLGYTIGDFEPDPEEDPNHNLACGDPEKLGKWCDTCKYIRWSSTWERVESDAPKVRRIGRRIQGCIVLPLTTYSGSLIGFQVRSIIDKSYDTFAIRRRPEAYFFGLAANIGAIWSSRRVFLVEGPFDELIFERLVTSNVLSITTSSISKSQTLFLRRFVDEIVMLLDLDSAGREGIHRFKEFHSQEFDITCPGYPRVGEKDKDLGDYWKRVGDEKFSKYFSRFV